MKGKALAALSVAVLAVSWGAPLARLTDAAPLAVAAWRMGLATALLAPYALLRGELRVPKARRASVALAGCFLGLHFGLWIPSLWLTSVCASVVLVSTAPLWLLLASPRFLGVGIRARNLVSFAVALAGVALIARGDVAISARALVGDAMALGGAFCMAGYLLVGKRLRHELPLAGYLTLVYGGAAAALFVGVAAFGVPALPRNAISWLPLLAMAAGPTLTGHTLLNWSLAHLEAYRVNLAVLFEPVLATFWAWLVLGEAPPFHVIPGAVLVLAALALEFGPERAATRP
jgi:drug/metabolite transporter (DMT)-like permease